ncbi:MAG: transcription termination factor NusA [Candidatus Zixiibacteriota bacterium]|nr:MAG: transcription termination factor NusA [candidate division Zixibacteria bacterium]
MNYDIIEAFGQIAAEKNLALDYVLETVESALISAVKKKYPSVEDNIRVEINRSEGEINVYMTKEVVEKVNDPGLQMTVEEASEFYEDVEVGQQLEVPLPFEEFGRNAIATAKQILIQKVREAEREKIFNDFKDKVNQLITGNVQQVEKSGILVNLGRAEAIIPLREMIKKEKFRQGDRIRAIITDVQNSNRGPQISLSRASDDFLRKLFEHEVPEIAEKIIDIKAIAREAGERSKVAVYSNDDRIDAVGACVGVKGVRVQNIVRELNNERIDIVPWSSEPMIFVTKALAPAKIASVDVFPEDSKMLVAVADDKLSLAIGKAGQNARLAAKLTGWKINIMSETEYEALKKSEEEERIDIEAVTDIAPRMIQKLIQAGFETAQDVVGANIEKLMKIEGIGEKTAQKLRALCEAAISTAAEERAVLMAEESDASPGEMEFSPDDEVAPRMEDY